MTQQWLYIAAYYYPDARRGDPITDAMVHFKHGLVWAGSEQEAFDNGSKLDLCKDPLCNDYVLAVADIARLSFQNQGDMVKAGMKASRKELSIRKRVLQGVK